MLITYSKNPPYMFLSIFATVLEGSTSMTGVSPSGILVKVAILTLLIECSRTMKKSSIYRSYEAVETTENKSKSQKAVIVPGSHTPNPTYDARPEPLLVPHVSHFCLINTPPEPAFLA